MSVFSDTLQANMEHIDSQDSFWRQHSVQITVVALVAFILICFGLFELGFRIAPGITLERIGTLSVTGAPKGTSVYVDGQLSRTTQNTDPVNVELVPGTHTVIVSAPKDYPWSTNAVITSGKKTVVSPILLGTTTGIKQLTGDAAAQALAAIALTTLPSQTSPLSLENGCAAVYVDNNQIIVSPATTTPDCTPPPYLCVNGSCKATIIFAPRAPIDALFTYPGRQDAVVLLLDHSLYALGLDPRTPQFFAPIAHGQNPKAGMLKNGSIVTSDQGVVTELSF